MGAKKRPAAADSGKVELKAEEPRTVESFATETSMVKPQDTVAKICEAARLVRSDKADKLVWCSAFDGTTGTLWAFFRFRLIMPLAARRLAPRRSSR